MHRRRGEADRITILSEAAARLLSGDADAALREAAPALAETIGADVILRLAIEPDGAPRAALRLGADAAAARTIEEAAAAELERRARAGSPDPDDDDPAPLPPAGLRAFACEPIPGGARPRGALAVASRSRGPFEPQDRELLRGLARLLGLAGGAPADDQPAAEAPPGRRLPARIEEQLAAVLDGLPIGVVVCDAPSGRAVFGNEAAASILRRPRGEVPALCAEPDWPLARVLATGEPAEGERLERRGDGSEGWVRVLGAPIRDGTGALAAAVAAILDIDEERRADERRRLLVAELAHRVRNALAVVQGVAATTLAASDTLDAFSQAFQARLGALAVGHTHLLNNDGLGAPLRPLAERILAPLGARAGLDGPEVELPPKPTIALALVLSELATNAASHGAGLSPAGRVALAWEVAPPGAEEDEPRLLLRWGESGLSAPPRVEGGAGARIVRLSIENDLRGRARLDLFSDALTWTFTIPLPRSRRGEEARWRAST